MRVQVKPDMIGYYNLARKKSGDVFELREVEGIKRELDKNIPHSFTPEEQFSDRWMIRLDPSKPVAPKGKKNDVREPIAMSKLDPKQVIADKVFE